MNLPQEAIDPKGPIASRGGSIPVFLRNLLQLMIFQGGGGGGSRPSVIPLD